MGQIMDSVAVSYKRLLSVVFTLVFLITSFQNCADKLDIPKNEGSNSEDNNSNNSLRITSQPEDLDLFAGNLLTLEVKTNYNSGQLKFQWYFVGGGVTVPLLGKTQPRLEMANVQSQHSGDYYVKITVENGPSIDSDRARVSITVPDNPVPPTVVANPVSQTIEELDRVTFTAAFNGFPAPTIQWQVDSNNDDVFENLSDIGDVSGVNTNQLNLANIPLNQNSWKFRAVATNSEGSQASSVATLTVTAMQAPTFVELQALVFNRLNANNMMTCTRCHSQAGVDNNAVPFSLEDENSVRNAQFNGENIVVPGAAVESRLYDAISGVNPRMPRGDNPLTLKQQKYVALWINSLVPAGPQVVLADNGDFGTTAFGALAPFGRSIMVTNNGANPVSVNTGSITNLDTLIFQFPGVNGFPGAVFGNTNGTCLPNLVLNTADSCALVVNYQLPQSILGLQRATLSFNFTDMVSQQSSTLETNLQVNIVERAVIEIVAVQPGNLVNNSYAFGSVNVGQTSVPAVFTVRNVGGIQTGSLQMAGVTNGFDFDAGVTVSNPCPQNLAPGAQCNLGATFSPNTAGARTGAVKIGYLNGTSIFATEIIINLSGTGL